jgi:hypothetical protein
MASRQRKMALSVASMVLAVPATDCELIVAAVEIQPLDTRLSHPVVEVC